MNIAIIEKGHFEVAYTLISLFDMGDNKITIFIDEASVYPLNYLLKEKKSRYTWIIQSKESNREFIEKIFHHLANNPFDLIYFDTIADNFIDYARRIRKSRSNKMIMTFHDINGFFHFTASWSVRRLVRFIGKRELISLLPAFNVLSETLIPHLKQKLPDTKKIFNIPGSFFDPGNFNRKEYTGNEVIKITVPGSVDTRRRDYSSVFELLNIAHEQKINILITLLGGFTKKYSSEIHAQCLQYLKSNNDLHIYEKEVVPQEEFDRVMTETHFIWMPLCPTAVVTDGATEQYGISISSGNTGDVIRHARPFFAPAHFNTDKALGKSRCTYSDIAGIIDTLKKLNSTEYNRLQNEAFSASMNYTKEKIIERNRSLFK